ncbi:MAG TPA: hypothetical protein VGQ48_05670 [Gemmatimonadales bacterium]|jgi:hypothetical protein|nr:hypothetical protein [Gemmatimonadales bacterium]
MSRPMSLMLLALLLSGATQNCDRAVANDGSVFTEDFESGTLAAWPDGADASRQRVLEGQPFAQSGSHYLEVTYAAGSDGGWLTRFFMPGYDSLYVSYYVRFPENWRGGTKLIGLFGARTDNQWSAAGKAGVCPQGADFFIAMVVTEPTGNPGPTRFYTYYPGMAPEPDGVTCWGRYGDGTESYSPPLELSPGAWHRLEFMVTLNTPGQSNGNQRLWIDGALRGTWSGLRFRSSSVLRLNAVQLTFSRSTAEASTAQKLWVDNLVVSTRRPSS